MNTDPETKKTQKGAPIALIIFSGLSFIPMLGFLIGFISIIIGGINYQRHKVVLWLGVSGIIFWILIYTLFYMLANHYFDSNSDNDAWESITRKNLTGVYNEVLNYKCRFGEYPDSLDVLTKYSSYLYINDILSKNRNDKFYYQVQNDTFLLFSVGRDTKPFTKDDIIPETDGK
jgi:hypothetical protein